MKRSLKLVALLAAALAVALAISVQSAAAAQPTCGQTVTEDTWLEADLDCSGGGTHGLVVGAHGITIDLHGYAIIGADQSSYDGVHNSGGYDGVTVKNGSLRDWGEGVYMRAGGNVTEDPHLKKLTITSVVSDGVELQNTRRARIDYVTANTNGDEGIQLRNSPDAILKRCTANGNGFGTSGSDIGVGIYMDAAKRGDAVESVAGSKILHCTANGNRDGGINIESKDFLPGGDVKLYGNKASSNGRYNSAGGFGIRLHEGHDGSTLIKNKTYGNERDGVEMNGTDPKLLLRNYSANNDRHGFYGERIHNTHFSMNTARDNGQGGEGDGFHLIFSNDLRLTFNKSIGNNGGGSNGGRGYAFDDMQTASIVRNLAKGNDFDGFELRGRDNHLGQSISSNDNEFVRNKSIANGFNGFETRNRTARNLFLKNTAAGSRGGDGFHDGGSTSGDGNTYRQNTALVNDDDGIDSNRNDATIVKNLAVKNGGKGVEAGSGVSQAMGNRALANGEPCDPAGGCSLDIPLVFP